MFELNKNHKKYLSISLLGLSLLYFGRNRNNIKNENIKEVEEKVILSFYQEDDKINRSTNKEVFISDSELIKIKKLKELNYLSLKLSNIMDEIPKNEIRKPDVMLINSIKLLMDSINNKMNQRHLNETIKLFIEINKIDHDLSYNNILSGEILSYLASL